MSIFAWLGIGVQFSICWSIHSFLCPSVSTKASTLTEAIQYTLPQELHYVPPTERGDILLLVQILSASAFGSVLSALYLLNQWVDLDQTETDTHWDWGKEVISFR